ncbi:MAG: hypothetical protein ACM3MF_08850, partial [Anaerolineae bacterium]
MPGPRRAGHSRLATITWVVNVVAVVALLAVAVIYFARQPVEAAADPLLLIKGTPRPTRTPAPTSFYLPTITPNPLATLVEDYSTPTPFVFGDGPEPGVLGYSVEGRPIKIYTFGQGEVNYLIVAGIHGGYEGNTVDLANQVLVYLSHHPEAVPSGATLYIIPDMNPDAVARGR